MGPSLPPASYRCSVVGAGKEKAAAKAAIRMNRKSCQKSGPARPEWITVSFALKIALCKSPRVPPCWTGC